jgi:DNA-binding beta-propeller fold protein YncE
LHAGADSTRPGIAVLQRSNGVVKLARTVLGPETVQSFGIFGVFGMTLTHDGKLLVAAGTDRLSFYDIRRLTSGTEDALLGTMSSDRIPRGYLHVDVTSDDQFLFASDHDDQSITVVNLAEARKSGFTAASIVGTVPVGERSAALSFSPDERYLYTTTEVARASWNWPDVCSLEGRALSRLMPDHAQGAIVVISVAKAIDDPAHSVVATVAAGCNPVRLAVSPAGDRLYVTARSDSTLLTFDTQKLLTDPGRAQIGRVVVGQWPGGVALIDGGTRIAVANRVENVSQNSEAVTIFDATSVASGHDAVVATVSTPGGPMELRTTADGSTLLVTDYASQRLELIDLARLSYRKAMPVAPEIVAAQDATISGKVTGSGEAPLAGAYVTIDSLHARASANATGQYTITIPASSVRGQSVTIRVRAIGYAPQTRTFMLTVGTSTLNFSSLLT